MSTLTEIDRFCAKLKVHDDYKHYLVTREQLLDFLNRRLEGLEYIKCGCSAYGHEKECLE